MCDGQWVKTVRGIANVFFFFFFKDNCLPGWPADKTPLFPIGELIGYITSIEASWLDPYPLVVQTIAALRRSCSETSLRDVTGAGVLNPLRPFNLRLVTC